MTSSLSLSTFSSDLGCQVLNPDAFKPEVINAFHPDYVKTYMPEFLSRIRQEEQQKTNGEKVAKTTPMKMRSIKLSVTEFHTYAKAGIGNVKPKGKKK